MLGLYNRASLVEVSIHIKGSAVAFTKLIHMFVVLITAGYSDRCTYLVEIAIQGCAFQP